MMNIVVNLIQKSQSMNLKSKLVSAITALLLGTNVHAVNISDIFITPVESDDVPGGAVTFQGTNILSSTTVMNIGTGYTQNVNVDIYSNYTDMVNETSGTSTQATTSGSGRTLANTITFPTLPATTIKIPSGDILNPVILSPGTYGDIEITGSNGVITIEPGIYYFNSLKTAQGIQIIIPDPVQADDIVTAQIYVKTNIQFGSSNLINATECSITSNPESFSFGPSNKLFIYAGPNVQEANLGSNCMSGYFYVVNRLKLGSPKIQGAVSVGTAEFQNGTRIFYNPGELINTDFGHLGTNDKNVTKNWHMVGIPADMTDGNVTVSDVFGDDFNGTTYGTDWSVWRRDFDTSGNVGSYTQLALGDFLESTQSTGYWLGNAIDTTWSVGDLSNVGWNIPQGTNGCVALNGCVKISLSIPEANPTSDTRTYRNNLIGYSGTTYSDWADYRIIVDNNTTNPMTPDEAFQAGYIYNLIAKYDVKSGTLDQVSSQSYTECDDLLTNGNCFLYPYEGFWIRVMSEAVGHTLDLVIPNGTVK
jgi:hypothetical protein